MRLIPKNWADFQHYKDRAPPWIKLHKGLLDNYEFQCLPVASRALAPMLWLLASEHPEGEIDADAAKLAFRLRMTEAEVDSALQPLVASEFFVECKRGASKTPAKPRADARPETEGETEKEKKGTAAKLPACPHTQILELYAKHLPMLPQPKPELWNGRRAQHLAARWKWLLTATKRSGERYASDEGEALAWLDRFFGYVAQSDFLTGRNGKFPNCDLGWLVNEENFAKVVQGNYENKPT